MFTNNEEKMVRRYPGRKTVAIKFREKSVNVFAGQAAQSLEHNNPVARLYATYAGNGTLTYDDTDDANDWGGINELLGSEEIAKPSGGGYGSLFDDKKFDSEKAELYYYLFKNEAASFTWLIPNVIAGGAHPFYYSLRDDLDFLKKEGIKAIVSAFDEPIDSKYLDGFEYYFTPTLDQYTCDLLETCEFISNMEKENKPVFIHCFAGMGRTGTVLAAYLLYKRYLAVNEAIAYVRKEYSATAIESKYQEDSLRKFAARL